MRNLPMARGPASHPSGFTLLELLISLTIVGVILVIIFGSLRIGARAWEKGEADVEAQQRERVVLDLVKRQIASACVHEIEVEDEKSYIFKGDDRSMAFMCRLPVVPTTRSGLVYVKYVINTTGEREDALVFHEQNVVSVQRNGGMEEPDPADFHVLIPGAYHMAFEYLRPPEAQDFSPDWQQSWEPDSDEGLPMAVRMTFQRSKGAAPLRVIARIHSGVSEKEK
ncbi:MAG: type II secretion system protein J [Desulfobacteraceae bacterium]